MNILRNGTFSVQYVQGGVDKIKTSWAFLMLIFGFRGVDYLGKHLSFTLPMNFANLKKFHVCVLNFLKKKDSGIYLKASRLQGLEAKVMHQSLVRYCIEKNTLHFLLDWPN